MLWVPSASPFQLKIPAPQILGVLLLEAYSQCLPRNCLLSAGAALPKAMIPSWSTPHLKTLRFRNIKPGPPCHNWDDSEGLC